MDEGVCDSPPSDGGPDRYGISQLFSSPLRFTYMNWKGETADRSVQPQDLRYGTTQFHKEPQWFLCGFDLDRQADRAFAVADIIGFGQSIDMGAFFAARPRSSRWPVVRKAHLERFPACEACGGTAMVQVHHVLPFHERPDLELEESNLITLCEKPGGNHHLLFGHLGSFASYNTAVREDAAMWLEKIKNRP